MIHKDIRYRRMTRRNAISRKLGIMYSVYLCNSEYLSDPRRVGQLAKSKVHCSCPICAVKSTKEWGARCKSVRNYKASDQRKFVSLYEQLKESA